MWGDPERAASLDANDPLATLLFQIASPAHIPWGDSRWQELLHGYDVWVHIMTTTTTTTTTSSSSSLIEGGEGENTTLLSKACQSLVKHAAVSSNLAALCLHVTRMLRVLVKDVEQTSSESGTADFSKRVSRVGKARATAGALQLLIILCHPIIANSCASTTSTDGDNDDEGNNNNNNILEEVFLYHTRGDLPCDQPSVVPLLHSILDLISVAGGDNNDSIQTPEVYDAVVLSFQLLFVLLGTQLYQPFQSSFEENVNNQNNNYVSFCLQQLFRDENDEDATPKQNINNLRKFFASSSVSSMSVGSLSSSLPLNKWTPQSILETCMEWQIRRPPAPERSLAHSYYHFARAAVASGQTLAPDGMYESHLVVQAAAPKLKNYANGGGGGGGDEHENDDTHHAMSPQHHHHHHHQSHHGSNVVIDATKGVLTLSSSIILLPFRLMNLVLWALKKSRGGQKALPAGSRYTARTGTSSRTQDVLWLSESNLADLGGCLVLLLVNNFRNGHNPFRQQLKALQDNRWQRGGTASALPDLPTILDASTRSVKSQSSMSIGDLVNEETEEETPLLASNVGSLSLTLNFESLFEVFGRTLHTEPGALMLYTLLQSSPNFAESLAVRSDLDTLVLPLLRTMYFASRSNTYTGFASSKNTKELSAGGAFNIRSCPFRSLSQLYVIIILLLLFSQDPSFGRDAFRRITVPDVVWYKERNLRNINLGSVLLLTLLRSVLSNLYRIHDLFLLNNCCAVLMNLAPSIVDLHEYAAMRLASVTVTVLKRHAKLAESSPPNSNTSADENDEAFMSSPLGMYGEVARTLLDVIKHCLSSRNIDRNLHLVYSLVYHQVDVLKLLKRDNKNKLYSSRQTERIYSTTHEAALIIQQAGARTANKALNALEDNIDSLHKIVKRKKETVDDFTFTYEEEADPEVFFVPYVWETIVCVVTSSSVEWRKDSIQVFPLLEPVNEVESYSNGDEVAPAAPGEYNTDADDLV